MTNFSEMRPKASERTSQQASPLGPWAIIQSMPRSRYLLIVGVGLNTLLAFMPWATITLGYWLPGYFGGIYRENTYNAISLMSFIVDIKILRLVYYETVVGLAVTAFCVAPGIISVAWLHGRIQSWGQRLGVSMLSLWVGVLSGIDVYAIFLLTKSSQDLQVFSWRPELGLWLLIPTLAFLWVSVILLWREIIEQRTMSVSNDFERQTSTSYFGAALISAGLIVWFIGFYGYYWLFPEGCRMTPPFAFSICGNHVSSEIGFDIILDHSYTSRLYWILGVSLVVGGLALCALLWARFSQGLDLRLLAAWVVGLLTLTGISLIGTIHIAQSDIDDHQQATIGITITLVGLLLLIMGGFIRWRTALTKEQITKSST